MGSHAATATTLCQSLSDADFAIGGDGNDAGYFLTAVLDGDAVFHGEGETDLLFIFNVPAGETNLWDQTITLPGWPSTNSAISFDPPQPGGMGVEELHIDGEQATVRVTNPLQGPQFGFDGGGQDKLVILNLPSRAKVHIQTGYIVITTDTGSKTIWYSPGLGQIRLHGPSDTTVDTSFQHSPPLVWYNDLSV